MLKSTLLFLLMLVVAFAVLEGIAATVVFGHDLIASFLHTSTRSSLLMQRDDLLGWRIIPNLSLPDRYGPGQDFTSNAQGFRNTQAFPAGRPAGRIRAVCSGDSFTMGVGVANDDTWCSMFAAARPDVESVNLGTAGYGVGQAYLHYDRDAAELTHDLHFFAAITDDFRRMQLPRFQGENKPYFTLQDGVLKLGNVPVPETSKLSVWWTLNQGMFTKLHLGQIIKRLQARFADRPNPEMQAPRELAWKILEQVHARTRARNAKLVLIYLPERANPMNLGDDWRQLMQAFATEHDVPFIDVYSHVHRLPVEQREAFFSPVHQHFSVAANQLVADLIWETLGERWQPEDSRMPVSGAEVPGTR